MPYIDAEARKRMKLVHSLTPAADGELVYCIAKLVRGWLPVEPDFQDYERAIGALECAKLELYRRMVAVYEDQKLGQNGDVF